MIELIPSLLVESEKEFDRRLRLVDPYVQTVHVDVLDGTLFPHVSWYDPRAVGDIETPVKYELHLMVENPLPIIEAWKEQVPNLTRAIIHAEIDRPQSAIFEFIHQELKLETGLALNPETPIDEVHAHLPNADMVLVMGVHPGASGQPFGGEYLLEKMREIKKRYPKTVIGCDGGVTLDNAEAITRTGCERLIVASALFSTDDPKSALKAFQTRLSEIRPL